MVRLLAIVVIALGSFASAQTVNLSTTAISFNNQVLGTISGSKTIKVTNTGAATLIFGGLTAVGDFAVAAPPATTCGSSVAPGKSCVIGVTFAPTATGTRIGSLVLTDNAYDGSQSVSLSGIAIPAVALSPSNWDFGGQVAGSSSATKAIQLTNNLPKILNVSSIVTVGSFAIVGQSCGSSVAAGGTCSIGVTFRPTALGATSGALLVNDSGPSAPDTAALSGTGIAALALSPTNLSFGSQYVGTSSSPQTATLSNPTPVPITISSITVSGEFSVATQQCDGVIAPGISCTIGIAFSPTAAGTQTGTLTVIDAAANSPQQIPLTGNGATTPVTLSTSDLSFSRQLVGTASSVQAISLSNSGGGGVTGITVSVTGDFSQTNSCPSKLSSGTGCTILVTFSPTAVGVRSGSITINDSAPTSPQRVVLSGLGYSLASIAVGPPHGSIAVGGSQRFTAIGTYTDGTTQDLTSAVTWSSSPATVAAISGAGIATGISSGEATITAAAGSISGSAVLNVAGGFVPTGSLNVPRYSHTATVLHDGRVLIVGGSNGDSVYLSSAELFDPFTGTYTLTGSLNVARTQHSATLLPNGQVLIAGGAGIDPASAELYDPVSGTFTMTGRMASLRYLHTATLLQDGKVLLAGGYSYFVGFLNTAEIYDPAAGTFTATGNMSAARYRQSAALLNDGRVLIAGGYTDYGNWISEAELYNPATGVFSQTASMSVGRRLATATVLANGMVLVAGGESSSGAVSIAELYDPTLGAFISAGSMTTPRTAHTATLLPDGLVLIAGGLASGSLLGTAELYNPSMGQFSSLPNLVFARADHTAVLLGSGSVLLSAGINAITVPYENGAAATSEGTSIRY